MVWQNILAAKGLKAKQVDTAKHKLHVYIYMLDDCKKKMLLFSSLYTPTVWFKASFVLMYGELFHFCMFWTCGSHLCFHGFHIIVLMLNVLPLLYPVVGALQFHVRWCVALDNLIYSFTFWIWSSYITCILIPSYVSNVTFMAAHVILVCRLVLL